jgi:hypothetical protein
MPLRPPDPAPGSAKPDTSNKSESGDVTAPPVPPASRTAWSAGNSLDFLESIKRREGTEGFSEFLAHGDADLPVDAHRYGAKGFLSFVRPR